MIPNIINYIWLGESEISKHYFENVNTCYRLNPKYQINIWRDTDCIKLINKYNLNSEYSVLSGIQRYNFIKYLIMHDTGGVYTDFDIKWKVSFDVLMNLPHRYHGDFWPLNVEHSIDNNLYFPFYIKSDVTIADDPFFICMPGIMLQCLLYCKTRKKYNYDIELFYKTGIKQIHQSEPYGPYGLTEWLQKFDIKFNLFFSEEVIERNSVYANHENGQSWR